MILERKEPIVGITLVTLGQGTLINTLTVSAKHWNQQEDFLRMEIYYVFYVRFLYVIFCILLAVNLWP